MMPTALLPTIIHRGDALTLDDWVIALPPMAPFGQRASVVSTEPRWGTPVTVWRGFTPDPETERGVLLECANGDGIVVYVVPGKAVQHARIGLWLPQDALHGTVRMSLPCLAPEAIIAYLYWLARDPDAHTTQRAPATEKPTLPATQTAARPTATKE